MKKIASGGDRCHRDTPRSEELQNPKDMASRGSFRRSGEQEAFLACSRRHSGNAVVETAPMRDSYSTATPHHHEALKSRDDKEDRQMEIAMDEVRTSFTEACMHRHPNRGTTAPECGGWSCMDQQDVLLHANTINFDLTAS